MKSLHPSRRNRSHPSNPRQRMTISLTATIYKYFSKQLYDIKIKLKENTNL